MDLSKKYNQLLGERNTYRKGLDDSEETIHELEEIQKTSERAVKVIQTVAEQTQAQLQYKISELVTLALSAVFDDPYEFKAEFVQRRNKTECDLWFVRRGNKVKPINASGGGAVDVAAFALRLSLWTMQKPRTRALMILDEPFKNISADLQYKASAMLRELSEKLGMQFLIVTHNEILTEAADKVFRVTMRKDISKVTEIEY